jgi:hypothetical protein
MQNGGKRPNAGRKKGGKNKKTLEQRAVQEAFNLRVMNAADALFHAQLSLAVGSVKVFRVDEEEIGEGKTKKVHTLVLDDDEIKQVLDETEGAGGTVGDEFYFVQTVPPDNRAIDSLLNRALGKPRESHDLTTNGKDLNTSFTINVIRTNKKDESNN